MNQVPIYNSNYDSIEQEKLYNKLYPNTIDDCINSTKTNKSRNRSLKELLNDNKLNKNRNNIKNNINLTSNSYHVYKRILDSFYNYHLNYDPFDYDDDNL